VDALRFCTGGIHILDFIFPGQGVSGDFAERMSVMSVADEGLAQVDTTILLITGESLAAGRNTEIRIFQGWRAAHRGRAA
jgi:hypothetical protein